MQNAPTSSVEYPLNGFGALNNPSLPQMVDQSMHIQPEQAEQLRSQ